MATETREEAAHTPGPWTVVSNRVYGVNGEWVADTFDDGPIDEADARLIAAAPDLLDALKEMVACVTNGDGAVGPEPSDRRRWLDAMVEARSAIWKAEGR